MTWTAEYRAQERDVLIAGPDDEPLVVVRPREREGEAGRVRAREIASRILVMLAACECGAAQTGDTHDCAAMPSCAGEEMHPTDEEPLP